MPYYHFHQEHLDYLKYLADRIREAIYTPVGELTMTAWTSPEPLAFAKRQSGRRRTLKPGDQWGGLFDCAWFHFAGQVPASAKGEKVVCLIDLNGEACVVDESGCPALGLTNVNSVFDLTLGKPGKREVPVAASAKGGEKIDFWADAGCNDLFGELQEQGRIKEAQVAVCHEEMRALYYDYLVLEELMSLLPPERARRHRILAALTQVDAVLTRFTEEEARQARRILAPELAKKGGTPSLSVSAIGHSHLDLGWLWPIRETIRKGARTFSTVLANMEHYPDYHFGASQPQLYEWMKIHYPALYGKVKKAVAAGRWEPQGAMWVESDSNVPCGESLVRQILYGKRFFRAEFGRDMKIHWTPDVFGYTAALPQLLKKSGVDYFVTTKMSWNQYNQMPHHTFFWQGLDGSRILTHMPPEGTYNSSAAPRAIFKIEKEFADKMVSDQCLLIFGIGDGGGGPGEEHLEKLAREKNLDGLAPVKQEPAEKFFRRLERDSAQFKTWSGELYLERHQGTLTTQARSKRFNRQLELALRDLEFLAAWAARESGFVYPRPELDAIWKEMLLYQFHDILPGSSIGRVYEESLAAYGRMLEQVRSLTEKAAAALTKSVDTAAFRQPTLLINSLSWARGEWVQVGGQWHKVELPLLGYRVVDASAPAPLTQALQATERLLENDLLHIRFSPEGQIESIFDREHRREVLAPGAVGNRLDVYEDAPPFSNAWEIRIQYVEKPPVPFTLKSSQARLDGPRAILRQTLAYGSSTLVQEVILTAGSRRIDFVTWADWHEAGKMLRTSFPVAIRAEEASCEIQFGHIKRPTHANTGWDMARFEVSAQKWVDLSQPDYGVALLNDCKYGHRIQGSVLDLNLLRSTNTPDPKADQGRHEFTYALYPHGGDHLQGGVIQAGYELNVPLRPFALKKRKGTLAPHASLFRVGSENIVVEAVKQAEDSGALVLRLYEAHGASARARVECHLEPRAAWRVNLMEEKEEKLKIKNRTVELDFSPFEIQTVLFEF